ncbi:MAG: ComF family protein [Treponema sp.]|jgi:ComF family protein|nr:ComF family protein [Treponema sp.]
MDIMRNGPLELGEKTRRLIFFLREYFFPAGCALCGATLITIQEAWYGLCENCRNTIEDQWAEDHLSTNSFCDLCGRPLVSERERCLPCRNAEKPAFDRAAVFFPYTGKYRRLLNVYKFGKNLALGNFFAEKIQGALANALASEYVSPETAIVPVPPRPGKIRKTGWDQVEYLATLLEKNSIKVSRCLKRLPSKIQKTLNRAERKTNLRGRIILKGTPPQTVILIDDVMTTGSTLDVCAAVLKEGGTKKVYGICLFYD